MYKYCLWIQYVTKQKKGKCLCVGKCVSSTGDELDPLCWDENIESPYGEEQSVFWETLPHVQLKNPQRFLQALGGVQASPGERGCWLPCQGKSSAWGQAPSCGSSPLRRALNQRWRSLLFERLNDSCPSWWLRASDINKHLSSLFIWKWTHSGSFLTRTRFTWRTGCSIIELVENSFSVFHSFHFDQKQERYNNTF